MFQPVKSSRRFRQMVSVVLVLPDGTREMKCRRRKKKKLVSLFSILSRFVCLLGLPSECQMMMVMISSAFHYLSLHQWFPLAELSPEIYCCTTAFIQLKLQLYLLYFHTQLFSPYFQCSTFFILFTHGIGGNLSFISNAKSVIFLFGRLFVISRFLCHYYHLYY